MSIYETLTINGTDLADLVSCYQSLDGLYSVGVPRGENVVIPGVDGELWVEKSFGTTTIDLGLTLAGNTVAEYNDALRALRKLVAPGTQLALRRKMSYTTGNEVHRATGEFAGGLEPSTSLMRFGRTTLSIKVLDGLWYANTTTTETFGPSTTITVPGEARTHRMTITIGLGKTLTNETTGHTVTNTATANGPITIDVEAMTATNGDNDDVSNLVDWNMRYPFRLVPGDNELTYDGVSGWLTYRAAYQ